MPTLRQQVLDADLVLSGVITESFPAAGEESTGGYTHFQFERVIKSHPAWKKDKDLVIPRYWPVQDPKNPPRVIVFLGRQEKTRTFDPYHGIAVTSPALVEYLVKITSLDVASSLRFAFDNLDHADSEIAGDAFKELASASSQDVRKMAKGLPADSIGKWLENPQLPASRCGLYSWLLGHCGADRHADLLRQILQDRSDRLGSSLDSVLMGYVLLRPKPGWSYVREILADPDKPFLTRYSALRVARFLWHDRNDLVSRDDVVKAVCLLLDQSDIADLAIEDLRKWSRWDVADRVIVLFDWKSHDIPIIRRSILRYALSCKNSENAANLVRRLRQKDPEFVSDTEELLRLEASDGKPQVPETTPAPKSAKDN